MSTPITFDEHALKYLTSPPSPSYALRDIILCVRTSADINALAMVGRGLLRSLVISRIFSPPIPQNFEEKVDTVLEDIRLARVAHESGLLERLKVQDVPIDTSDVAHILCAYVGATLRCGWGRSTTNSIDDSVNAICSIILDHDSQQVRAVDIFSDDNTLTSLHSITPQLTTQLNQR